MHHARERSVDCSRWIHPPIKWQTAGSQSSPMRFNSFQEVEAVKTLVSALVMTLAATAASADVLNLTGTVRDFHADGVNFEGAIIGLRTGLVSSTLSGASPSLTGLGSSLISNSGAGAFSNWYTRGTDSMQYALTLSETAPGSGLYSYTSNSFFPIDNQLYGNEGNGHNYHFTYAINATFGYVKGAGQTFSFAGDDDVWVYFDNLLGIDLGGVHGSAGAAVNLDTLFNAAGGRDSGNYSFNFFFAERHLSGSNLSITTSLQLRNSTVPEPGTLALVGLAVFGAVGLRRRRT